jgi:hypothetical protein
LLNYTKLATTETAIGITETLDLKKVLDIRRAGPKLVCYLTTHQMTLVSKNTRIVLENMYRKLFFFCGLIRWFATTNYSLQSMQEDHHVW